jgi:hypothetical protein
MPTTKVIKHPSGAYARVTVDDVQVLVLPTRQSARIIGLDHLSTDQLLALDEAIHIAIDILNDGAKL